MTQRLSVRERLGLLLDHDSMVERETDRTHRSTHPGLADKRLHSDGVITGWGRVGGRQVGFAASDPKVFGGSLGEVHADKICRILDWCGTRQAPMIFVFDSGGARIQEGLASLDGFGRIFRRQVALKGVVPQLAVIAGPCAGGAAYAPALADFIVMIDEVSQMFLTGPDVVRTVTGEDHTAFELGGARLHAAHSGLCSYRASSEDDAYLATRYLISILPSNRDTPAPRWPRLTHDVVSATIGSIVPADPRQGYDVRRVVEEISDDRDFFEIDQEWAPNLVCGFGHLGGICVGFVANQPDHLAGVLNADASSKGARFVTFCSDFGIPVVCLVDVPGFLPGMAEEKGGTIRFGSHLLAAFCAVRSPLIQVVLRKAYGGAYIVMGSKGIGADYCVAWPDNEMAVLGAESAVEIVHRRELLVAVDREAAKQQFVEDYRRTTLDPRLPAESGYIDMVVRPEDTRALLIKVLADMTDGLERGRDA